VSGKGNRSTRRKPAPSAAFSTTNPTWLDPGSKPGRRCGMPATNHLVGVKHLIRINLNFMEFVYQLSICSGTKEQMLRWYPNSILGRIHCVLSPDNDADGKENDAAAATC
jgi:hypothetical protein